MKSADKNLIVVVILIVVLLYSYIEITEPDPIYVDVSYDGKTIYKYDISDDGSIETEYGNIIKVSGGRVWVEWASCPDGLCVKQGEVYKTGQSIICIPNKTVIQIVDR